MKKIIAVLLLLTFSSANAAFTVRNGKIVDAKTAATQSPSDHYNAGVEAHQNEKWKEAARQFRIVTQNFPAHELSSDAAFFLGLAEYKAGELEFANEAFSLYIKGKRTPHHFQEAIDYKLLIANDLANGAKRRLFGTRQLPKWGSGTELALQIYDEVIAAVPCHENAAKALYAKGHLKWNLGQYKGSVESFQMIPRRFPKHELAPEAYVAISQVYVDESADEFQNPDALAFAQINLRRFKQDFPKEKRVALVEEDILAIKENYAKGLYQTGQFYERTKRPTAAVIYYQKAVAQFPETKTSEICRSRLEVLDPKKE